MPRWQQHALQCAQCSAAGTQGHSGLSQQVSLGQAGRGAAVVCTNVHSRLPSNRAPRLGAQQCADSTRYAHFSGSWHQHQRPWPADTLPELSPSHRYTVSGPHAMSGGQMGLWTGRFPVKCAGSPVLIIAAVLLLQPLNLLLPAQPHSILAAQTRCPPAPGVVSCSCNVVTKDAIAWSSGRQAGRVAGRRRSAAPA